MKLSKGVKKSSDKSIFLTLKAREYKEVITNKNSMNILFINQSRLNLFRDVNNMVI